MRSFDKKIFLIIFFFTAIFFNEKGSAQYLRNGAMNAPDVGHTVFPYYWGICDVDSDPLIYDVFKSYDSTGVPLYSPDRSRFILLRTRGKNLNNGHIYVNDFEQLFTRLFTPLEKDNCYKLTVDLAFRSPEEIKDDIEPNINFPVKFQVFGGLDSCSHDELLVETNAIKNEEFINYSFDFKVKNNNYNYLYIRVYWDTINIKPYKYNGIAFIDNLEIELIDDEIVEKRVFFTVDPPLQLDGGNGIQWQWEQEGFVSNTDTRFVTLVKYTDVVNVTTTDQNGCTFRQKFKVVSDCNEMYPDDLNPRMDTLIEEGTSITLQTLNGTIKNIWEPPVDLSCVACPAPVATPTSTTTYVAKLVDEFGCEHEEIFYIKIDMVIPNIITPNNDEKNDFFKIKGLPPGSSLSIFDKNGFLVYSENSYGSDGWWEGTNKQGDKLETGNYWYVIELRGEKANKKGFIFVKQP